MILIPVHRTPPITTRGITVTSRTQDPLPPPTTTRGTTATNRTLGHPLPPTIMNPVPSQDLRLHQMEVHEATTLVHVQSPELTEAGHQALEARLHVQIRQVRLLQEVARMEATMVEEEKEDDFVG